MTIGNWTDIHATACFAPDEGGGGSEAPVAPSGGGGESGGSAPPPSGGEAAAPSTPSSGEAATDWSALGAAGDEYDVVEVPERPPAAPQAPTPPAKPQEPPPAVPQQAPAEPAVPPAAAQPHETGTGEAGRPLSASDPWRIAEGLEANREAVIAHLAQSKFALSEEDIKALDTDVTVAVPQLLARVFLESQMSMQKFLAQAVPGMVKQYNTVSRANDDAEEKFFNAHRALDRNNPQHRATTVRIASLYRQANPGIPLDQLIREVGPMVMAALQVNAPPAQAGAAPARPKAAAFVPAVNGGGGMIPTPAESSPWEGLGRDYD